LAVNSADIRLGFGQTFQWNAIVSPHNASDKRVTYSSSDTSVATVDANGLIRAANRNGQAHLTVRTHDSAFQQSAIVTVSATNAISMAAGTNPTSGDENTGFTFGAITSSAVRSVRIRVNVGNNNNEYDLFPVDSTNTTWRASYRFPGWRGVLPITFNAYDASGRVVAAQQVRIEITGPDMTDQRRQILARAQEMLNFQWTPTRAYPRWSGPNNHGDTFPANQMITGMPYSLVPGAQQNLGNFRASMGNSNFYTMFIGHISGYGHRTGAYYGNSCMDFVSVSLGLVRANGNPTYSSVSGFRNAGLARQVSWDDIRACDIFIHRNNEHIMLFERMDNGRYVVMHQTNPKTIRESFTRQQLIDRGYLAPFRWVGLD
jgi:hypothetical protein